MNNIDWIDIEEKSIPPKELVLCRNKNIGRLFIGILKYYMEEDRKVWFCTDYEYTLNNPDSYISAKDLLNL